MKRCLLTAAAFLAAAVFSFAQEIRDIETTVNLFRNGNAQVIQKWDMTVTEGTEWYIPIDNPGKSYIHGLQVFENGQEYANDGRKWDSNRSREAKTRRCGIVEKGGGDIEICWGQGDYGDHIWTVSYIIDKLVQSYPECDGFHWHFLNDEWYSKPQHVSITIRNETDGDPWFWERTDSCNVRFWGFGLKGRFRAHTDGGNPLRIDESRCRYRVSSRPWFSLTKDCSSREKGGDGTFEELKEEAMEGSDYGDKEETLIDKLIRWIGVLIFIGIPVLGVLGGIWYLLVRLYRRITGKRYRKEVFGKSKIDAWNRDVPLGGNPSALYSLDPGRGLFLPG